MTYPIFISLTDQDGEMLEINVASIAMIMTMNRSAGASILVANGWYHTKHSVEEIKQKIRLAVAQDLLETEVLT